MALSAGEIEILLKMKDEATAQMRNIQSSIEKSTGAIKNAIVAGFSVAAVTNAINKFADYTGALTDLSAKTGISTSGLQKLEHAFAESGVTLEQVTGAVGMLSRSLIGGSDGAVAALDRLGLSANDLQRMQPDQAFLKIADAAAKIPNPLERSRVMQELFGKSGASLLPALTGHLQETTAAYERMGLVLSEDVVKAGDDFGDAMTVMKASGMALLGSVLGPIIPVLTTVASVVGAVARTAMPALQDAFNAVIVAGMKALRFLYDFMAGAADAGSKVPLFGRALGATADAADLFRQKSQFLTDAIAGMTVEVKSAEAAITPMPAVVGKYGTELDAAKQATDDAAKTQRELAEQVEEANRKFRESVSYLDTAEFALVEYKQATTDTAAELRSMGASVTDLASGSFADFARASDAADRELREWANANGAVFAPSIRASGTAIAESDKKTTTWRENLSELAQAFSQMAQASDGAMGTVAGGIARVLTSVDTAIKSFKTLQEGIEQGFTLEGITKMATGIVGLIGSVANLIKGWFGVSEEVKKARNEVKAFEDQIIASLTPMQKAQAGGERWREIVIGVRDAMMALGHSEAEALALVQQLWDTDHPERARAAIERINEILGEQEDQTERLNAAMERYGISWEDLGEAARNARLHELGTEIIQDFTVLVGAGADAEFVIGKMGDAINDFVVSALRTGGEVPAAMRPMLERMIEMGILTDENGEKMTDLSRINFAESLTQGFDRVVDRLNQILRALGWEIPDAAESGASRTSTALGDTTQRAEDLRGALEDTDWETWARRGVGAAADVEAGVNNVIEMHSPTGLEGIIYYSGLAADALEDMARSGVDALDDVAGSIADAVDAMGTFKEGLRFERIGRLLPEIQKQVDALTDQMDVLRQQERKATGAARDALRSDIEALQAKIDELRKTPNPFEGFAAPPTILGKEDAVKRIQAVFGRYLGREATGDELAKLAGAYGFNGVGVSKDRLDIFLKKLIDKYLEQQFEGFASGTGGMLKDFGAGTPVILHGKERVQTEAEVRRGEGSGSDAAVAVAMARMEAFLPMVISRSVGTAMAKAMATRR